MGGGVMGGGVVIVLAALLWLVYLVPTWLRRREYLATERNAVRLQQTLRILAETAEVPPEVRAEATAKDVALQQRALRRAETRARRQAEREAELAALAATEAARRARMDAERLRDDVGRRDATSARELAVGAARRAARATRRARAATSLVLLVGVVVAVVGGVRAAVGDSALSLVAGLAVTALAVIVLSRLAARRPRVAPARAVAPVRGAMRVYDDAEHERPAREAEPTPARADRIGAAWMPTPLPRPLHLENGTAADRAMSSVDAARELRRAAARADLERRIALARDEAERVAGQVRAEREAARAVAAEAAEFAAPSAETAGTPAAATAMSTKFDEVLREPAALGGRFAAMGVVEDQEAAGLDLDAVLRRRRAG